MDHEGDLENGWSVFKDSQGLPYMVGYRAQADGWKMVKMCIYRDLMLSKCPEYTISAIEEDVGKTLAIAISMMED